MRAILCAAAVSAVLAASPSLARSQDRPITDREVKAEDVATSPLTDLNLRKDDIPVLLINAQVAPYQLTGLDKCAALVTEVEKFDSVLGPDMDLPQNQGDPVSAGQIAKSVVSSFIPFRGVLRELSGANDQERKVNAAIRAGMVRRAYLKGVGSMKNCPYPARAATANERRAYVAAINADQERIAREKQEKKDAKDEARLAESTSD